jgi:hypothetical protein
MQISFLVPKSMFASKWTPKVLVHSVALAAMILCSNAFPLRANAVQAPSRSEKDEFFEKKVRPILAERCWGCHSAEAGESKGALRLDHGTLIGQGGDSGPAVVAGNPDESLIFQAVNYQGYEMPPDGEISAAEIEILRTWIADGAEWPDEPVPELASEKQAFDLLARKATHWVWRERSNTQPPVIDPSEDSWSQSDIDRFILKQLLDGGLRPNSQADRRTLVRRIYLDLIGTPPSIDELERIVNNQDPEWYADLVDDLLSNPQFGVRWARHWLDLVRFAQSRGHEFDEDTPATEPYRDYVVRALNADVPYDQFMIEHIAGDLIESPRLHPEYQWNESILGTGFWHLGEWVHSPVDARKDETDRFDNMVDVFSKTFLGMTVACARCHDHKFDAISQEDYYAIYGYLQSSDYRLFRYETDSKHRELANQLWALREPLAARTASAIKELVPAIQSSLQHLDPNAARSQELAKKVSQDVAVAKSVLPLEDPRVRYDARNAENPLWTSDSVIYGRKSTPALSVSLATQGETPKWSVHRFEEGYRDPFWNPMVQESPGVNRQNRYSQVQEAGKILPTPKFRLESGKLSYLVRGSFRAFACIDSHRLIAGPLHGETILDNGGTDNEYRWVTHSLDRYRGKIVHLEFAPLQDKAFAIVQVIDGPAPTVTPMPLDANGISVLLSSASDALQQWVNTPEFPSHENLTVEQRILAASTLDTILQSPQDWIAADNNAGQIAKQRLDQTASEWVNQERQFAKTVPWSSKLALAMRDGAGFNDHLLIRGNPSRPGPEVPRRNLEALGGKDKPFHGFGSGRLDLALDLVAPESPLASRVVANRIWHHLLGRGLAPSTDDFGVLGVPPTHPELLDYLANDLVAHQWSIKHLIRSICLSSTYRQDSRESETAKTKDPSNILLSHARVRRLEAEAIRDTMLSITGQLDLRWMPDAAPSVPVHLTEFLEGRGRPGRNGPLDGMGKRSLYLEIRRNFLNPMMTTFDTPTPFSTMGRRNVSNVPAQSLILLNDPLVHQLADRWSQQILKSYESDPERVRSMMLSAVSREPTQSELDLILAFLQSSEFKSPADAYRSLAHMILNNKEILFRF